MRAVLDSGSTLREHDTNQGAHVDGVTASGPDPMMPMPADDFTYDVFLSYNEADADKVRTIYDQLTSAGMRVFFARVDLHRLLGTPGWEPAIFKALQASHDLGVYCTKEAVRSRWVQDEIERFRGISREGPVGDVHLIVPIPDPDLSADDLDLVIKANPTLREVHRPRDAAQAVQLLLEHRIKRLTRALGDVEQELDRSKKLAKQSFDYYRHARFWRPFSESVGQDVSCPVVSGFLGQQLHIFTCGRDTAEDKAKRGSGGRTSIDKWDYQAAVDITHHFARHHRDIKVVIEQPENKEWITDKRPAFDTAVHSQKLLNRNCIVIGSPDVSDFAEITLARLLGVDPYSPSAKLERGFRIVKRGQRSSTFYADLAKEGKDGIVVLEGKGEPEFIASTESVDHGVMILADNPFSQDRRRNNILILAGHSGVATRAMSLLLTLDEKWCLDAFYELDQQLAQVEGPVAAVIEVSYTCDNRAKDGSGDGREIIREPGMIRTRKVIKL